MNPGQGLFSINLKLTSNGYIQIDDAQIEARFKNASHYIRYDTKRTFLERQNMR